MEFMLLLLAIKACLVEALSYGSYNPLSPIIKASFYGHRTRRELDDEDVINRFEMERVSPLYDIIRYLPPFDDGWLPNPVTRPTFPLHPPTVSYNGSSAFGEFKIELSKDEEHVVSESGRQFQENSALNWYYSAESYSSINHQNKSNTEYSKIDIPVPKGITRKLDEEHVVSHVPSLRGGRGTFIDFSLLESSTTPKIDMTTKDAEPKPNITTRYILLQSGRIVAINVTSVPSVYKPNSPGSSNRNPNLPTFYFGSRIRSKNSTKPSAVSDSTSVLSPNKDKIYVTQVGNHQPTQPSRNYSSQTSLPQIMYPTITTLRPQVSAVPKMAAPQSSQKFSATTTTLAPIPAHTVNAPDRITSYLKTAVTTPTLRVTVKDPISVHDSKKKHQNRAYTKSVAVKPHVVYVKLQALKQATELAKPLEEPSTEFIPTLDEALRWWSEMKAKNERKPSTIRSAKQDIPSRNIFQTLLDTLQPATQENQNKHFEFKKKQSKTLVSQPPVELTSSRAEPYRAPKANISSGQRTTGRTESGPQSAQWNILQPNIKNVSSIEKVNLEPAVPLPERRHDFVRIVTIQPPAVMSTTPIPSSTTTSVKGSRRPRYRGLSHINLQSPAKDIQPDITTPSSVSSQPQATSKPSRKPVNQQVQYRSTAENPQGPTHSKLQKPVSAVPQRRSRHGFHLRNSLSFQTIPPGSLTDRRTLTWEPPATTSTSVENLPPPLEHLLIISFEPTRKSVQAKESEELTGPSRNPVGNSKKHPVPTKKTLHRKLLPISSPKPLAQKPTQRPAIETKRTSQRKQLPISSPKPLAQQPTQRPAIESRTKSSRNGRHFRNNAPKTPKITEEEPVSIPPVTRQQFRVYFFEPKRKKSKSPEISDETESSTGLPQVTNNSRRGHQPSVSPRYKKFDPRLPRIINESNGNRRQPKQLSVLTENPRLPPASTTTAKPLGKRLKNSPFIWHRPNVGISKPASKEVLIEVQQPSSQSPIGRRYDDGFYRPQRG